MRSQRLSLWLVLVAVAMGCSNAPPSLVGDWKGTISGPGISQFEQKALAFAPFRLSIKPDHRFTLSMGGDAFEGKLTQSGKVIKLGIESFKGKEGAEMESEMRGSAVQFFLGGKPLSATFEDTGKLTVVSDVGKDIKIEFKRATPAVAAASTVSAAEQKLVGSYISVPLVPTTKPDNSRPTDLQLLEDNTYVMELIVEMRGTWKLEKGKLVLADESKKATDVLTFDIDSRGDLVDTNKTRLGLPFKYRRK